MEQSDKYVKAVQRCGSWDGALTKIKNISGHQKEEKFWDAKGRMGLCLNLLGHLKVVLADSRINSKWSLSYLTMFQDGKCIRRHSGNAS
jgi:hypothetical protein